MTSSACSGKCWFCPYPDSYYAKNPSLMPAEMFKNIVSQYPEIDTLSMYLFNDPFLDNRLFDLMVIARETSRIRVFNISTNASVIPKDVERLKDFNHELWVSFHGANKEAYERIMGLNYENSLANIIKLDSLGFKFRIRGAGAARVGNKVLFTEDEFFRHWNNQGIKQELEYFTFHDRGGNAKNVSFGANVIDQDCPRYHNWFHYDNEGKQLLCCHAYNRDPVGSRELCKHCIARGG